MPLFGRSKKAQDTKKLEAAPASQPAPYRHVPKHAASDAANHGLAESDRTAQQKRIMAASQARLNSMNSNYSVKSNFTNVPISGNQSKPFVFSASKSPQQSIGSVAGKDRAAVQPGSPAGTAQPTQKSQEDYVRLRNPSLLSNTTAPRSSSPDRPALATKHTATTGGIGSSDSGYGSAGKLSRPDSNKPYGSLSKATTEPRHSQDTKSAPRSAAGIEFLPKLDFTPESSRPTTASEQGVSPIQTTHPASIIASRDRASSNSSSYVSRLDPGSDRRSVASFQSKPFDQIDFRRPGPQFVPAPAKPKTWTNPDLFGTARPESRSTRSEPPPVHAPEKKTRIVHQPAPVERSSETQTPAQPQTENMRSSQQVQAAKAAQKPLESSEFPQELHRDPVTQDQSMERRRERGSSLQLTRDQMINETSGEPPAPDVQEEEPTQPHDLQPEPTSSQPADPSDDERGRTTPKAVATPFPPIEQNAREASTSRTRQPEQAKPQVTRHRNWSRPSQSSGSQLDYGRKPVDGGLPVPLTNHPTLSALENGQKREVSPSPETQVRAQETNRSEPPQMSQHVAPTEQAPQTQAQPQMHPQWNDQASSIYGESSFNPSTRQHSPSRRHSFAPSELLDQEQSAGRATLPPLSILDGLKVNKRGKILDEEGDPIGELIEGDIIDCVRQKANAFGHVLDDYGRVVGRVSTTARGGDVAPQPPATAMRSRGFSEIPQNPIRQYTLPESQLVSPATPTLARPFEYTQEEDPRQRAAKLQAAAARRDTRGPEPQIELDGSGYAEAAPLVDHSEIFAPPFIPSRSPKRSPAEPATQAMDHYFTKPPEKNGPSPETVPRLKTWASRNLEQDREEMQASRQTQVAPSAPAQVPPAPIQAPAAPASTHAPSDHTISRPSTAEAPRPEQKSIASLSASDTAAQNFISSDQPKDIFPWMTGSAAHDTGKWSSNIFTYKGEIPAENENSRQFNAGARSAGAPSQNQSAFATNGASTIKQYPSNVAATAGSRKSKRNSHQPHVKSPLSTHSPSQPYQLALNGADVLRTDITPPDTSAGALDGEDASTPRPSSQTTNRSSATAATDTTATTQRTKTYFTHNGRTSVVVPDTMPTHTANKPPSTTAVEEPPPSPLDAAIPPDVARTKEGAKKKSRWSMTFGKKAPPVQNLLRKE